MGISNNASGLRPGVCTSTTRPTTPYNGQLIYETDTKKVYIYNGTSWVEQPTAGMVDAKGDLLVGTAADTAARLAVGSNDQVLVADSAATAGVKWAALSGIGGAWTSWTPTVVQGTTTFTLTVNYAKYTQIQKLVVAVFGLTISSGTGQSGSILTISVPVTAASSATQGWGSTWLYDSSANTAYGAATICNNTTTANFQGDWSAGGAFGSSPVIQFATSDQMRGMMIYEAA